MTDSHSNCLIAEHEVGRQLLQIITTCRQLVTDKQERLSVAELEAYALELKRVSGALSMLASKALALLAREVGEALAVAAGVQGAEKIAVLMLVEDALAELDDAVQKPSLTADMNYHLLTVINTLREQRGAQIVTASEVHTIDLDVVPVNQNLHATLDKFIEAAKTQAHQFQAALLAWYQDCENPDSINVLVAITDSLRLAAVERPHIQFFEVIAALIDSQRGCSQVSQSVRLLLAHVERYIRQLAVSDTAYVPTALTKEALFHIVTNAYQRSERVLGILGRYGLRDRRSGRGRKIKDLANGSRQPLEGLFALKDDSTRQALTECRHELASMEQVLEAWLRDQSANPNALSHAYDISYRVMRCFELVGLDKHRELCASAQSYLVELQSISDGTPNESVRDLDTNRYMTFAEAVAALACSLDEVTQARAAMSLNVESLLRLSEARFAELNLEHVAVNSNKLTLHEATNDESSMPVNKFIEETENLLDDFDSLLETSDLLSLSDQGIVDDAPEPDEKEESQRSVNMANISQHVDVDIVESFIQEASGLLDEMAAQLAHWRSSDSADEPINALQRSLHTLKGSSLVAGYRDIGDLCHGLESMLSSIQSGLLPSSPQLIDSFEQSIASMRHMLGFTLESSDNEVAQNHSNVVSEQTVGVANKDLSEPIITSTESNEDHFQLSDAQLHRLFQLNAEELVGQTALFDEVSNAMSVVAELDGTIYRLSSELDDSSTSPDQKVRLAEAISDMRLATNQVLRRVGNIETHLDGMSAATSFVRQSLVDVRMVGIGFDANKYQRLVEQTSAQLEKNVALYIGDTEIKFDRVMLRRISAILGHILRNAVDHGIETEEIRLNAGKPARAAIRLACSVGVIGISITITDDGAGIDTRRIWRKALKQNLVRDDEPYSEEKAIDLLFDGVISTKTQVTQVSGRGVGLNAVRAGIEELGGTISVSNEFGRGVCFALCLPYSIALMPATIITAAGQRFALPGQIDVIAVAANNVEKTLSVGGKVYECDQLGELLQMEGQSHDNANKQALLLNDDKARFALIVDAVEGSENILSGEQGNQLKHADYLAGIGLLEEGGLVPILNPVFFLELNHSSAGSHTSNEASSVIKKTILLVDDSLTMRRYCEKVLDSYGYQVKIAKTAEEALELSDRIRIDLLLSDLQLPKMSGFELAESLRAKPEYRDLPVVLISASEYDEEQSRQYNIAAWLNKPYRDEELYEVVTRLMDNE